jgi:hypothetical protein
MQRSPASKQTLLTQSLHKPYISENAMPQEPMMFESEVVHAGSKRRNLSMENGGDFSEDGQGYSGDEKVVQTTKSKGIVNVQLFIRSKSLEDARISGSPAMPLPVTVLTFGSLVELTPS